MFFSNSDRHLLPTINFILAGEWALAKSFLDVFYATFETLGCFAQVEGGIRSGTPEGICPGAFGSVRRSYRAGLQSSQGIE
jgi:hypothetical protein